MHEADLRLFLHGGIFPDVPIRKARDRLLQFVIVLTAVDLPRTVGQILLGGPARPFRDVPFLPRLEQGWAAGLHAVAERIQLAFAYAWAGLEPRPHCLNIGF